MIERPNAETLEVKPPGITKEQAVTLVANCLGCGHGQASTLIDRMAADPVEIESHSAAGDLRRFLSGGK